jgi:hypothetical protein
MGETANNGGGRSETGGPRSQGSAHDRQIDEFLFKKELDEAYLLMDFISGRSDKDLSSLTVPDPAPGIDQDPRHDLPTRKVVERLALIRYPPTGTQTQNAIDAALLILAKDRLTALASPARGLTIAYTVLFTEMSWIAETRGALRAINPFRSGASTTPVPTRGHRFVLAESAFPGLVSGVRRFVLMLVALLAISLGWLILTAFTYWDVAIGRSIAQRIDQIHLDRLALYQANPAYAQPGPPVAEGQYSPPGICGSGAGDAQTALACWKLHDLAQAEDEAKNDLQAFKRCGGTWCVHFLHPIRWGFVLCGVDKKTMLKEQSVVSVLSVFNNYVLPMMFGVLGTFVMAFRSIQSKVRESTLSPRDSWNTLLAFPLGIVAGVAVGLFYSPSSAPPIAGGNGLATNLSLTTSGLGFLAGYGSHPFFEALDSLLKTVFKTNGDDTNPTATGVTGAGRNSAGQRN